MVSYATMHFFLIKNNFFRQKSTSYDLVFTDKVLYFQVSSQKCYTLLCYAVSFGFLCMFVPQQLPIQQVLDVAVSHVSAKICALHDVGLSA